MKFRKVQVWPTLILTAVLTFMVASCSQQKEEQGASPGATVLLEQTQQPDLGERPRSDAKALATELEAKHQELQTKEKELQRFERELSQEHLRLVSKENELRQREIEFLQKNNELDALRRDLEQQAASQSSQQKLYYMVFGVGLLILAVGGFSLVKGWKMSSRTTPYEKKAAAKTSANQPEKRASKGQSKRTNVEMENKGPEKRQNPPKSPASAVSRKPSTPVEPE